MKTKLLFAALSLSVSAMASAQGTTGGMQNAQPYGTTSAAPSASGTTGYTAEASPVFRYPEQNPQPRSALRVREIAEPGAMPATAPRPVTDTPDSVAQYQRCQRSANREATSIADMQGRLAGCLSALDARRQAGQ